MIEYQMHEDGMFPRVFCDVCHKPITASEGNVFWDHSGQIAFGHIGACGRVLHARPYSWSLEAFFADLLGNSKITPAKLKEADELRNIFGTVTSRKKVDKAL